MSKEEGKGLTFFLFLWAGSIVIHSFSFSFFFCLLHFLLVLFSTVFSCRPCPNSFSVQRFRHWFGASSYRASYRNGESRCRFAFFLLRPIFQSDREGISLVRPPIVVLTRTNAPLRHLYAQVYRFCVTISGVLFLCFLGIETFRGNLWRVKFLLFQPRTTLVFSTLFRLCGRTTLPTPF